MEFIQLVNPLNGGIPPKYKYFFGKHLVSTKYQFKDRSWWAQGSKSNFILKLIY